MTLSINASASTRMAGGAGSRHHLGGLGISPRHLRCHRPAGPGGHVERVGSSAPSRMRPRLVESAWAVRSGHRPRLATITGSLTAAALGWQWTWSPREWAVDTPDAWRCQAPQGSRVGRGAAARGMNDLRLSPQSVLRRQTIGAT